MTNGTIPLTYQAAVRLVDALPGTPVAVEAYWGGDSSGWSVLMAVVMEKRKGILKSKTFKEHFLGCTGVADNYSIVTGRVPPYPQAQRASEIGEKLKAKYGVEFFFPSPTLPEEDCPRWLERDQAIRCADYIIPTDSKYLPKDICYNCHLTREFNRKFIEDDPGEGHTSLAVYFGLDLSG